MAEWRPLHQQFNQRSGLETGGTPFDPPLLPYEKSLIQAIGCSEDEYRELIRHAMSRQRVRPAEYEHIPESAAGPITPVAAIFINLAIGVALTAASVLLAPKAPTMEEAKQGKKIRGRKLADQIGPTRFNQATNFDNVASLAELNQPIPIPFGKKGTGLDNIQTGGLILAPALVWSRLYAYGSYQAFEGIYVAGEHGIDSPDLGGILLGTSALNSIGAKDFAFYFSSGEGNNRPVFGKNLLHGTEGPPGQVSSGATGTIGREIFTAPTDEQFSDGFSMAYTPSGDTTFGTSTPIHNGSSYRFNWEIVSAPFSTTLGPDNKQARMEIRAKRRKIAGSEADNLHLGNEQSGQPGVGRAYSRHMGFVAYNGTKYENKTIINSVSVNDTAIFEIDNRNSEYKKLNTNDASQTPSGFKEQGIQTAETITDLINNAKGWRERASELLAIGSRWLIGSSSWIVEKQIVVGAPPENQIFITFRCTALLGVATFGVAGRRTVEEALGGYEGLAFNPNKHCGAAFFNVCKSNIATIRPVRRDALAIELGIKSQVWNRASGLCNFNALPSPAQQFKFDNDDITLTTPRMDKFFKRSSCFCVWVRPVVEYGQSQETWVRIPRLFCVQGSAPIDQYNYLRIRPKVEGFFEYRLIPRTGSDVAINSIDDNIATVLDCSEGLPYQGPGNDGTIGADYNTPYGVFRITVQGRDVPISTIKENGELFTDPGGSQTIVSGGTPAFVSQTGTPTSNSGNKFLIKHAFLTQTFNAYARNNKGGTGTGQVQGTSGGKTITLNVSSKSIKGKLDQTIGYMYLKANKGDVYKWNESAVSFTPVGGTGTWQVGDAFNIKKFVNNDFSQEAAKNGPKYTHVTYKFVITQVTKGVVGDVGTGERAFELNSQVSDCSHYTELTKSNESGPEHEIVYICEFVDVEETAEYDGMSTIGFTVKSSSQISSVNQMRIYSQTGIPVYRLIQKDTKPSNLFADLVYYLLTSKTQGLGNTVPEELIDVDGLTVTANFLKENKILFDGVIEDSESFRSFLYDNASLLMCNFTIKNGRFGLQPALPFDGNFKMSLSPIQVDQIFTAGNIIEDSLQLQYIDVSQRSDIRGLVTWRVTQNNDLPYQASALLEWSDKKSVTEQAFDLSEFCTNRDQALRTAAFLMSTRRRVTKTVSFKTVPDDLGVQPGSYIRVITQASTYSSASNGSITDAGTLVSITTIEDGDYNALIYNPTTQEVIETTITVVSNTVAESQYHGSLFTLLGGSTDYSVYQIEQLSLEEDGLVSISAVEVPTDASGVSIVAKDVADVQSSSPINFTILE